MRSQVGACVPAGRLQTEDFDALADVADKYSNGELRLTCEENVLFPNVKNEDVEAFKAEPIFEKFQIEAGNIMRGLVSCTGSQFCGFALIETKNRCAAAMSFVQRLSCNRFDEDHGALPPVHLLGHALAHVGSSFSWCCCTMHQPGRTAPS